MKGSRRLDAKALHVVSAFATQISAVIGDLVVAKPKFPVIFHDARLKTSFIPYSCDVEIRARASDL